MAGEGLLREIAVEGGLGDPCGDGGEEAVQPGVPVLAVVIEGDEPMFEIELCAIAGLAALKVGCADSGDPDDRLLQKAKVEEPLTAQGIIQPNEFIDHAGAYAKTEHEGHQFPVCWFRSRTK